MANLLNRKTVKSQAYTFQAGGALQVPLQFLEPTLAGMRNPKIRRLYARLALNMNTGASGGPARQFPMILSRVQIDDGAGPRVNLKGSSLRVIGHAEKTGTYRDGIDIAASQTGATQDFYIDLLPTALLNEQGEDDHGILVSDLLNGGQIYLTWAAALTFSGYITFQAATTIEVYADVVDAVTVNGQIELPPRNCYTDENVSLTDYRYKVGGLTRWAIYYAGELGEDTRQGLALAQTFFSDDFNLNGWPTTYFVNAYRQRAYRCVDGDAAGAVQTEDPFLRSVPQAIALFQPEMGQPISQLPPTDTFQMRTTGTIGALAPVMIKAYYTKRSPQLEQAALRAPTLEAARAKIRATGKVADSEKSAANVQNGLAPFLPLRVMA